MKKINEGYCAELYSVDEGRILKLYKPDWQREDVAQEYENTRVANDLGIPSPRVYEFVEQEGRYGFVMDALEDCTMLHHIQKKPLRAAAIAKQLARLHFKMHSLPLSDATLPSQRESYRRSIESRTHLSEDERRRLLDLLEELTASGACCLCHGDFHPMNILFQRGEPVVIDFAFTTAGDPCADVAGTYMITRLLATASAAKGRFESLLYQIFTPLFARIYLKEYLRLSGRSREEILRWIPIRAATYSDLGLPEPANKKLRALAKKG